MHTVHTDMAAAADDAMPTSGAGSQALAMPRHRFFAALMAATLLPLLGLPLMAQLDLPLRGSLLIGLVIFVGGVAHVASTLFFYSDAQARPILRDNRLRFGLLPATAVLITLAVWAWGRGWVLPLQAVMGMFAIHLIWLYYHYQKQNYGLLAFAAAGSGVRLPADAVRRLMMLPPIAGGLATIPRLLADGLQAPMPLAGQQALLHSMAWLVYAVGLIGIAGIAWRHRAAFGRPWVLAFTLSGFGFYLPALLVSDIDHAFWSYALAHGFQYLLMTGIVAARSARPWLGLLVMLLSAIVGGFFLHRMGGQHALFLCGILLTWVHFVLDAKLWRMSEPVPRQYLRTRFAFLFDR